MRPFVYRLLPFLLWWPAVDRTTLRADWIAGAIGALVVLPQGVAFATVAGMPPQYGLYAAMVPAIVAALWGSSRLMVSGPTIPASIVLFSSLSTLAEPGSADFVRYALTLTFMVGAIQIAMGIARLGVLTNFISHSVIVGFTAGAAILIAANQLQHFFGLQAPRGLHFTDILAHLVARLDEMHPYATLVGMATVGCAIVTRRYLPRVPYMVAALLVGSLLAVLINAVLYGGADDPAGIAIVGAIPATLPPLSSPDFSLVTIKELAPTALAVTLFALTQTISIARSLATRSGQFVDANQEFIGQGLSNVLGSYFSSYVSTGSFNRSGLNHEAGARTPLAAVFAGLLLIVVVLLVAPLLAYLPRAAMAGIVCLVAWGLIDFEAIRKVTRASRSDSAVLWCTFFATLLLEIEFAILLGVFLSLVMYLGYTSRPKVLVRAPDPRLPRRKFVTDPSLPECPQLKIVRIDGSLFFGAVAYVTARLRALAVHNLKQSNLLIVGGGINFIDVAGAEMLAREAMLRRRQGGTLYLRLNESARGILKRGGYLEEIGEENSFDSKYEAIATIFQRLDRNICLRCDKRIFTECASVPRIEDQRREDTKS